MLPVRAASKAIRTCVRPMGIHVRELRPLCNLGQRCKLELRSSKRRFTTIGNDSSRKTPGQALPLFVQLPGTSTAQLLRVECEYVGDIVKAIIGEYGLSEKPHQLVLTLEADASRKQLDPTQTLEEAGITARSRLRVDVTAAETTATPTRTRRVLAGESLPYRSDLRIPQDVWDAMCPAAQQAVQSAGLHRQSLAAMPALTKLTAALPVAEAQALGIDVVRPDGNGSVSVGVFSLPTLRADITTPPKTFDDVSNQGQKVLLLPQRLKFSFEFVNAMMNRQRGFGVLLSGPNGVGKSGIGLLAYLVCMARGLPVAYVSRCEDWVEAASSKAGGGHEFFLDVFWRQNTDIIAATPALRSVFAAALRGDETPFTPAVMRSLQLAVAAPDGPRVGVIMDEVQHITQAVAKVQEAPGSSMTAPRQLAGDFFATSWHDWTNSNSVFPRMSIASAHGQRDVKLPDGEDHRLRIVEPIDPADTAALLACDQSPAFVFDPASRKRVVYIGGNVLRKLTQGASLLPCSRAPTAAELQDMWSRLWDGMVQDCSKWLASLAPADRAAVAAQMRSLLRGELSWGTAKPLYDAGIVYRTATSVKVQPVSAVAAAVILHVVAAHLRGQRKDIRLIEDGRQRGFELEEQLLSFLNPINQSVNTKLLDGHPGPALSLRCDYSLPFKELGEVVPRDVPVLYRPSSDTYPCDAILMPAEGDLSGAITLIECSTESPRSPRRVEKVLKWYSPEGEEARDRVPLALKRRYPSREVIVAICYDATLEVSKEELSLEAVALSRGLLPDPAAAAKRSKMSSSSKPGTSTDASEGAAAYPTSPKGSRGRQPKGAAPAHNAAGSTVRVLDSDSLRSIGLTV